MPRDTKEPQSYGSQQDWVTGRTGEKVNDPKGAPAPEHREFYDERRESETTHEHQGGRTSDVQLSENQEPMGAPAGEDLPGKSVTVREGGAKRDSYFRRRDYE
ncbi:MAG TPA: hypothetical protein VHK90_14900 [Thermoanaerobaculia bacterium]|nr:hypothetical protein [Thermoanaerobaculia bacterium]